MRKAVKGIKKLKKNIPIQHIIGYTYSNDLKFFVNKNVLIPRPETEYLIYKSINYIKNRINEPKILDIGTGSGLIAISLAKKIDRSNITAIDISRKALRIARKNAKQNEVKIKLKRSNLFNKINEKFDVIISNPPYISIEDKIDNLVYKNEPHISLFAKNNGLYFYEEILKNANKYLNKKNIIIFEIGENQAEDVKKLAKKHFKEAKVIIEKDLTEKNRYVFIINE